MVALTQARGLDFADALPEAARLMIRDTLAGEPDATQRVYKALAHKVWSLLIERRFDEEIRDWHALLNQFRTNVRKHDEKASERASALADLLRESISLSESSPAREVARRPNAKRILEMLRAEDGFVARRQLLEKLEMRTANLSNVLTQLVAHSLVDRRDKGKEAEFRLTRLGRQMLASDEAAAIFAPQPLSIDVALLSKILKTSMVIEHHATAEHFLPVALARIPNRGGGLAPMDELLSAPMGSASPSRWKISAPAHSAPVRALEYHTVPSHRGNALVASR